MAAPSTAGALAKAIARQLFDSAIPQGPAWFLPSGLLASEPVGSIREALLGAYADFKAAAAELLDNNTLSKATGTYLDDFGVDVGVTRKGGEDDNDYRQRIRVAILQASTTATELEALLEAYTGVDHSLFLPWTLEEVRGDRSYEYMDADEDIDPEYGRSGERVISSDYYSGGVLDIIAEDYSPLTRDLAKELVAGGIQIYFTTHLNAGDIIPSPALNVTAELEESIEADLTAAPAGSVEVELVECVDASVAAWNRLAMDTAIAWEDFAGMTWDQAIEGPVYAQPRPELVTTT